MYWWWHGNCDVFRAQFLDSFLANIFLKVVFEPKI